MLFESDRQRRGVRTNQLGWPRCWRGSTLAVGQRAHLESEHVVPFPTWPDLAIHRFAHCPWAVGQLDVPQGRAPTASAGGGGTHVGMRGQAVSAPAGPAPHGPPDTSAPRDGPDPPSQPASSTTQREAEEPVSTGATVAALEQHTAPAHGGTGVGITGAGARAAAAAAAAVDMCDECGAPDAPERCARCLQAVYCDAACQRRHWHGGHKRTCRAAEALAAGGGGAPDAPVDAPAAGVGGAADAPVDAPAAGVGGAADAPTDASPRAPAPTDPTGVSRQPSAPTGAPVATELLPVPVPGPVPLTPGARRAGGAAATADADADAEEPTNPCPVCLCNEDDAGEYGMCCVCGQLYCGECNVLGKMGRVDLCPTCRAPFRASDAEEFRRSWSLVHDRSPGRHTRMAQFNLGVLYNDGRGVQQDYAAAALWYRKAADQGHAGAQCNLAILYNHGTGFAQDHAEAIMWFTKVRLYI